MTMSYSKQALALAVTVACTGSAYALPIAQFNEADTANQVTLRIGGSSAHDQGLENLMRLTLAGGAEICKAGTLDIFRTTDKNNRLFFCTGGANSGALNKRLAVFKRSNGGSGTGVATVVRPGTITLDDASTVTSSFLDTSVLGSIAGVAIGATGNFAAYSEHQGFANGAVVPAPSTASDVGISDVEPAPFLSIFNPDLNAAEQASIAPTTKAISAVIFGVPVTLGVYQRLQAVEFAAANACNPNNAGYAAVANSEGCMPSLTKAQIQGLYTQNYADWSQIESSVTPGLNVATATTPTLGAMADTGVYIERRALSSGTEAGFEIFFMSQRCLAGSQTMATAGGGGISDVSGLPFVKENSSGNQIPGTLTAHDGAGRGALGTLTTELKAAAGDKWRFIKINGAAPTVLNVVKGTYDMFFESTVQYRNSAVNGLPALAALPGGALKKAVADAIASNIGKPNVVNDLDTNFVQLFGVAGLVGNGIDNSASVPVAPFVAGAAGSGNPSDVLDLPIALTSRAASGTLNACLPPVPVANSQGNAGQ